MEKTIATGNWGCGAFGGDFELKFLQQWLAASYAGVEKLYYYSFGRKEMNNVNKNYKQLETLTVGELYILLMEEELEKGKVLDTIFKKKPIKSNDGIKEVEISGNRNKSCCKNHCNII